MSVVDGLFREPLAEVVPEAFLRVRLRNGIDSQAVVHIRRGRVGRGVWLASWSCDLLDLDVYRATTEYAMRWGQENVHNLFYSMVKGPLHSQLPRLRLPSTAVMLDMDEHGHFTRRPVTAEERQAAEERINAEAYRI